MIESVKKVRSKLRFLALFHGSTIQTSRRGVRSAGSPRSIHVRCLTRSVNPCYGLLSLGDTKVIDSTTVDELHVGYLRNANIIGQPKGGLGVSLASQGFTTGVGTPGIVVQAPQFEGVENITFPAFAMGVPITNET